MGAGVATEATCGYFAPDGVDQVSVSARPDTASVIVVTWSEELYVKSCANPWVSVIEVREPDELNAYLFPDASRKVQVPDELSTSASGLPSGAAYVPSPFFPKASCRPSGSVTVAVDPLFTSDVSTADDQPAPNAPDDRGSRLLYVRSISSGGPADATAASVALVV